MALVTIEMGSGKRATLSSDGGLSRSAEQQAVISELMLHWPKYSGLMAGAVGHLRQLGLAGALSGDPVAALRAAIEDGRLSVSIARMAVGGGGAGGQPSLPPFPKANRFASVPGMASLPADKPLPGWATPSDVSAGGLMDYLESVVGAGAGDVTEVRGGASTLLGDAQPFDYIGGHVGDSIDSLAAATNNPNFAAKMLGYDRKTFGQMLHVLKPANGLGPADNVIFHDSGDVEFKGVIIDNIHDYAP